MENRLYFVVGDLGSNLLVGAIIGALTALIFGPEWNMFLAMIVGMVIGMAISLPFAFILGAFFGAMEIMLPVMTTGMLAGMVVSMAGAMHWTTVGDGATYGLICGAGVFMATYVLNAFLKPRAAKWTK